MIMTQHNSSQLRYGKGHILSRRLVRQHNQDHVELWLATEAGPVCLMSPPQTNVCFILRNDESRARDLITQYHLPVSIEKTNLKTLEQRVLSLLRVKRENAIAKLRRLFSAQAITLFESDIKLTERFLMERFAYGSVSYKGIIKDGVITDAQVKGVDYRPALSSLSLDIECDENGRLYSLGLDGNNLRRVVLVYNKHVTHRSDEFFLETVADEQSLLIRLCELVQAADPDIIIGWNIKQFDCSVLTKRAEELGVSLRLGRAGNLLRVKSWKDGQTLVELPGRSIIDGIEALKTMTYQFDSFGLDHVAASLLGAGKLIKENDQLNAIKTLYEQKPEVLAEYNFRDCRLVNRIAEQTRLVDFLVLRSTLTGLELSRPGGSVAAFINVYLPRLHRKGYVSGIRPADGGLASPGGYVMNSKPGLYNFVLVLDFKSLYPSIIRTFKIDPLGLAEGLKAPKEAIPGFKGACFSRTEHFLPEIIANLWRQRDEAKKAGDQPRSQAIKILMNSFYGVLGSGGCPFYDPRLASSITLRGHEIMQITAQWAEESGVEVIYGDTDSLFVSLPQAIDRSFAIEAGKQLQAELNKKWQKRLTTELNLHCYLELEFETCFDRFFMPTIRGSATGSKKRYAGLVYRDGDEELIFKGLENVRSDWTPLAKRFQEKLYLKVFKSQPTEQFISNTLLKIRQGRWDSQLVYQKRLRKPLENYTRSRPPHVKAAQHALAAEQKISGKVVTYNSKIIKYVMTQNGPQSIEHQDAPLDYEHYIDKQIRPIAESILPYTDVSFDKIAEQQLDLF